MSGKKMVEKPPVPDEPERSPFERMAELTRRLVRIRKEEVPVSGAEKHSGAVDD